jgi:hypothetical protein
MNEPRKRLNVRAFVALMLGFCGVGLPVTGLVNHFKEFSPVSAEGHAWHSSHNVLGVLFIVFSIWHIVLNRRPLWNHLRSRTSRVLSVSRELALAGLIVASALFMFVGHEFIAHGR